MKIIAHVLQDQTDIVNLLLKMKMIKFQDARNIDAMFTYNTKDGKVQTGAKELKEYVNSLCKEMKHSTGEQKLAKEREIHSLYNMLIEIPQKKVMQWILVTEYLSGILDAEKEIILEAFGSCFWGRQSTINILNDGILNKLQRKHDQQDNQR